MWRDLTSTGSATHASVWKNSTSCCGWCVHVIKVVASNLRCSTREHFGTLAIFLASINHLYLISLKEHVYPLRRRRHFQDRRQNANWEGCIFTFGFYANIFFKSTLFQKKLVGRTWIYEYTPPINPGPGHFPIIKTKTNRFSKSFICKAIKLFDKCC